MKTLYKIPSNIEKRLQTWNEWAHRQAKEDTTLKPCITISREFGCQAYPLAETLQKRLNERAEGNGEWTILDRMLLDKIAKESGYSKPELEYVAKGNTTFLSMMSSFMGKEHAEPFEVFNYTKKTIRYFAKAGNSIIVGRGGVCLTQDLPNVFHIRLVAPLPFKLNHIMKSLDLTEDQAREMIETRQGERDNFTKHFTKMDLSNSHLYHAVINNEKSTLNQITDTIITGLKTLTLNG